METAEPHDEDGDGVFDVCDNCPATANFDQADTTEEDMHAFADRVGDACDLRPGLGGDTLVRLYTFAVETQASEWSGSGFSISGDALNANASAQWSRVRTSTGDGLVALAQIASLSLDVDTELAIELDGAAGGGGTSCVLLRRVDETDALIARDSSGVIMTQLLAPGILPADPFTLIAWRNIVLVEGVRVARLICRMIRDGKTTEATLTLTDDLVSGQVSLSTTNAAVAISSLSVYSSPGPKNP